MKNMPQFSIIIPIYNGEKYIVRALDCIFSQKNTDYEIIAVNDGSTDNTGAILDSLSAHNPTLRVFHQENRGVGFARNKAIQESTGDYIFFMDIDDLISSDFFANAQRYIFEYCNPDLLVFGFNVCNSVSTDTVYFPNIFLDGKDEIGKNFAKYLLISKYGNGFLWNKLYKRELIIHHNIQFSDHKIQEDEIFNIKYFTNVNTISIHNDIYYSYFIDNAGNSRTKFVNNAIQIYECVFLCYTDLKAKFNISDKEFDIYLNRRFFISIMNWIRYQAFHKDCTLTASEKRNKLVDLSKNPIWIIVSNSYNSKSIEEKLYCKSINLHSTFLLHIFQSIYSNIRKTLQFFYSHSK